MSASRTLATAANLVDSVLILGLEFPFILGLGLSPFPIPLLVLAIALLIDSVLCYLGSRTGFFLGALLSFLGGSPLFLFAGLLLNPQMLLIGVVAAITVILNILALESRTKLAEESHPLNTPIFG